MQRLSRSMQICYRHDKFFAKRRQEDDKIVETGCPIGHQRHGSFVPAKARLSSFQIQSPFGNRDVPGLLAAPRTFGRNRAPASATCPFVFDMDGPVGIRPELVAEMQYY